MCFMISLISHYTVKSRARFQLYRASSELLFSIQLNIMLYREKKMTQIFYIKDAQVLEFSSHRFFLFLLHKAMCRQIVSAGSVCVNLFPVLTVFCQHILSLRRQFFSAGSAFVGKFLAHAHPAQAIFQRTLIMRKKHKMANICRSLRKKNNKFSSPQVTYPYKIY